MTTPAGTTPPIYLSYCEDTFVMARRVGHDLVDRFGHHAVYLPLPTRSPARLAENDTHAVSCTVMLVLIGPLWHQPAPLPGGPDQPFQREIRKALDTGRTVIPVLVDDTDAPDPEHLAGWGLGDLSTVGAVAIHGNSYAVEIEHLLSAVRPHVPETGPPRPPGTTRIPTLDDAAAHQLGDAFAPVAAWIGNRLATAPLADADAADLRAHLEMLAAWQGAATHDTRLLELMVAGLARPLGALIRGGAADDTLAAAPLSVSTTVIRLARLGGDSAARDGDHLLDVARDGVEAVARLAAAATAVGQPAVPPPPDATAALVESFVSATTRLLNGLAGADGEPAVELIAAYGVVLRWVALLVARLLGRA